jgi:hypothetical protein
MESPNPWAGSLNGLLGMPRAVLGSTREVGLNDRSRARLWRRSFNSHAIWFPIRLWENEIGYKAPKMLNLNIFWKIICATSESSLPKLSSKTLLVQGTERYNRK